MAINPSLVVYVTTEGEFSVPAILVAAYDTNGAVTTDISDTVTGDIIVLGGANTRLDGVTKGTDPGEFNYLTAYSA
jgi:hypothetical protein